MSWPRVTRGDRLRIPAGAYNALLDSLGRELGGNPRNEGSETPVEISVRNDTGDGLDDSSIVAIGQPVITPTDNLPTFKSRHVFSGGTPTASSVIGVLVNPLPDSSIGRAVVGGLAKVKVNVTDSSHGYASSTTSTTQLTSGVTGSHRILWKESGTGTKWAVVHLQNNNATALYTVTCGTLIGTTSLAPDLVSASYYNGGQVRIINPDGTTTLTSIASSYLISSSGNTLTPGRRYLCWGNFDWAPTGGGETRKLFTTDSLADYNQLAAYNTRGLISESNQSLGNGTKTVDRLGVGFDLRGSPYPDYKSLLLNVPAMCIGFNNFALYTAEMAAQYYSFGTTNALNPNLGESYYISGDNTKVTINKENSTLLATFNDSGLLISGGSRRVQAYQHIANVFSTPDNLIGITNAGFTVVGGGGPGLGKSSGFSVYGFKCFDKDGITADVRGLEITGGVVTGTIPGGLNLGSDTSGDLDGSRVGGVQCGANVITFNEGSR